MPTSAIQTKPVASAIPTNAAPSFIVNPATVSPDLRLGSDLSDWPRYLSFTTQVEIQDISNPSIKYPNLEAAIASAMYQKASTSPDLGPTLFSVGGTIHQKFAALREKMTNPSDIITSEDSEVKEFRSQAGKRKNYNWDQGKWDSIRNDVYKSYLAQRYTSDARFRTMIQTIKQKGGKIVFANGDKATELGVGIHKDTGAIVGGDNLIGKWMMAL